MYFICVINIMKSMKVLKLIILIITLSGINGYAQTQLPIKYRVENQSMSTPMTTLDEIFFDSPYSTKPLNIQFDGSQINMYYDNGLIFSKLNVTKVDNDSEYEDGVLLSERFIYTDNSNVSDTILFVVDYTVGYVQLVLPTKNSKGDYWGYTSYRKFMPVNELASK